MLFKITLFFFFILVSLSPAQPSIVFQDDFNAASIDPAVWQVWNLDAAMCAGSGGSMWLQGGNAVFRCNNAFASRVGITRKQTLDLAGKKTVISSTEWVGGDGITSGWAYLEMDFGNFTGNAHCDTHSFLQHTISFRYGNGTNIFGESNGDPGFSIYSFLWNAQNIIHASATYEIILTATAGDPKEFAITYLWIVGSDTVNRNSGFVNFGATDPTQMVLGYSVHHYPPSGDPWDGDAYVDKIVITQEPAPNIYFPEIVFTEPVFSNPNNKSIETTASQVTLGGNFVHPSAGIKTVSLLVNRHPVTLNLTGDNFSATFPILAGPNICRVRIDDQNGLFSEEMVTFNRPMNLPSYQDGFPRLALMAHMTSNTDNTAYITSQYQLYTTTPCNTEFRAYARSVNPYVKYWLFHGPFQGTPHEKNEWTLKDYTGKVQEYDGRTTSNLSNVAPRSVAENMTIQEWYAQKYSNDMKGSDFTGLILDSYFDRIINIPGANSPSILDLNDNGVKDDGDDGTVTQHWLEGQLELARLLRDSMNAKGLQAIPITINGQMKRYSDKSYPFYSLYPYFSGELIEYYPTHWTSPFTEESHDLTFTRLDDNFSLSQSPQVSVANVMYYNMGTVDCDGGGGSMGLENLSYIEFRAWKRMWLCQILMTDAYAAIEGGGAITHSINSAEWWEEYAVDRSTGESVRDIEPVEKKTAHLGYLGQPLGARQKQAAGYFTRRFENGFVIFNPTCSPQGVSLPENYYRIKGSISVENNGQLESGTFTIPRRDGMVLIKKGPVDIQTQPKEFITQKFYSQPNPSISSTLFHFELPEETRVSLVIYDLNGREIKTLIASTFLKAGSHSVQWNIPQTTSGIFVYQLRAGAHLLTRKGILLK